MARTTLLFAAALCVSRGFVPPPRARARRGALGAAVEPHPATNALGDANEYWAWRGQTVRYRAAGLDNAADAPSVVLVHGLFVNADHWRQNMPALAAAGFRVFAIDLLGNGYSSKPPPCGAAARALSGENGRAECAASPLVGVALGDARGNARVAAEVELRHPLGSCYNFYTCDVGAARDDDDGRG